jgi:hypothetical protein
MTYYVLLVDAYIDRRSAPSRVVSGRPDGTRGPIRDVKIKSGPVALMTKPTSCLIKRLYSIPHLAHRPAGGATPRAHTNTMCISAYYVTISKSHAASRSGRAHTRGARLRT